MPETPVEKARAKLTTALERSHNLDLLKIRSRESEMIEIELTIYGTAGLHSYHAKTLRGILVSWTKIDIGVDDSDVQMCTSSQVVSVTAPSSLTNINSLWFLKCLSESGLLIVHIYDRRHPQQ